MFKLKLKIKHILLLVLLIIFVWWGQSFIFSSVVFTKAENYIEENNEEMGVAYFLKYIKEFPRKNKALTAFEKVLNQMPHTNNFYIFMARGRSGGGIKTLAELEKLELLNSDFEKLKRYHKGKKLLDLQLRLAEVNYQANNIEKTKELFREVAESKIEDYSDKAQVLLIFLHLELNEVKEAKKIFSNINSDIDIYEKLQRLMKVVVENNREFINSINNQDIYNIPENFNYNNNHSWTKKYLSDEVFNMLYKNEIGNKINVKGYLKKGDKAIANAFVILQKKDYKDSHSHHLGPLYVTADYMTVTDKNGYYEFRDIEPGYYYLGVGITYQRVKDYLYGYPEDITIKENKVVERNINFNPTVKIVEAPEQKTIDEFISFELKWKEYPGAAYYKVYKGISSDGIIFYPQLGEKIYNTETTVQLTSDIFNDSRVSFDAEGISPGSIIGYEKTNCKIVYRVYAFDEKGNELSRNVDPFKRYSFDWNNEKELNRGDKFLVERKYEEAIKAYENVISKGVADADVYSALGKLYYHGYKYEGTEIIGKDYDKAEKYLIKAYEIGGDDSLLSLLRSVNIKTGEWKDAKHYNSLSRKNDPGNAWLLLTEARINLYQGNLELAKNYMLTAMEKADKKQDYVVKRAQAYLMTIYLLQGNKDKALQIEKDYFAGDKDIEGEVFLADIYKEVDWDELNEFFRLINLGEVDKAINSLPSETETGIFFKTLALIMKPRDHMKDDFYDLYQKQENFVLKNYLKRLGKEFIQSNFPHLIR